MGAAGSLSEGPRNGEVVDASTSTSSKDWPTGYTLRA